MSGLDIEQFKLTCGKCGHKWTPRTTEPKKCPSCGSTDFKGAMVLRPRRELYQFWLVFIIAGMGLVLIGVMVSVLSYSWGTFTFAPLTLGVAACAIMMVLGSPYYIEYRLYPKIYGARLLFSEKQIEKSA